MPDILSQPRLIWRRWRAEVEWKARMILAPAKYRQHTRRFRIQAGPGAAGFRGGLHNGAAVMSSEGRVVLLAKGLGLHWIDALSFAPTRLMQGEPLLWQVDQLHAAPGKARRVSQVGYPAGCSTSEDYRLFEYRGRLLVNHPVTPTGSLPDRIDRQVLAELDPDRATLRYLGTPLPDFPVRRQEKNWVYHVDDDQLRLFYSINPFLVLTRTGDGSDDSVWDFRTMLRQDTPGALRDPGGLGARVSFSTNPVLYDDHHLLVFVHQHVNEGNMRRYRHWAALVHRRTCQPAFISKWPVFDGITARGRVRGVLFLMSTLADGDDFMVYAGEGDSYFSRGTLRRAELEPNWRRLSV